MGKSLVAVNAGPRLKWNTDTLIMEAVKGAESQGASVQKFDLFRLERYTGCISCFGCKKEKEVTILRIGKKQDGTFRIFAANGEALDKPQQFYGTSIVVKTESDASALINRAVTDGWEPHFAVAMGNIKTELQILAQMLGIEFLEY